MDGFAYIVAGGVVAMLMALFALGRWSPRSAADVLDWKPARSYETEAALELEDIDQMLAAQNERRRARGEPERTQEQVELEVTGELRAQQRRSADYRAERADAQDLDQLLALANARRARRGEPQITVAELRAGLEHERDA